MSNNLIQGRLDFEEEMAGELAGRVGKKIKKKLKGAVKAVATGGLSLVAKGIKKKVAKTKLVKAGKKAVSTVKKALAATKKPTQKKTAAAKKVIAKVATKTAGDCTCKDEMAKLVAAKLVAQLGPPIDEANKILAKFDLQRQATYEHRVLMRDDDFRRRVLEHIANKALHGNKACKRTLSFFR